MTEVVAALIWDGDRFLACQRPANKARGLLWEFVGGKVEPGETGEEAAYRELAEDTGIGRAQIELTHVIDFTYYLDDILLEFWAGRLKKPAALREEKNPLRWFPLTEDFFDASRFAGNGNIGHMLLQLRAAGMA